MRNRLMFLILGTALLASACAQPVLKQHIPVSSDPMGATIYVDGQQSGLTPATLELERTRNHIVTLTKEDYRQIDVPVTLKYQREKVIMGAIQQGINTGFFTGKAELGVTGGLSAVSSAEKSGEAYILEPAVVMVKLAPAHGPENEQSRLLPLESTDQTGAASSGADSGQADTKNLAKNLLKIGATAGAAAIGPQEKKIHESSSSKSYVKPNGTMVTEKKSTSVSVGVNPGGLVKVLDQLFN